jgi:hypothetical protein
VPSNYSKNYTIPSDFPLLLKAFTREVLRAQPDDIWTFGASYFQELQMQQAEVAEQAGATAQRMSPEELRALLKSLFEQHDADKSGALDMKEFKARAPPARIATPASALLGCTGANEPCRHRHRPASACTAWQTSCGTSRLLPREIRG